MDISNTRYMRLDAISENIRRCMASRARIKYTGIRAASHMSNTSSPPKTPYPRPQRLMDKFYLATVSGSRRPLADPPMALSTNS